jgi:arylsulfatase A-like enzyme
VRRRLLLAALLLFTGIACERAPRRPNVLFVSIDTLRADHCSLYGYPRPTTPRLDGFARQGVVFEHAYAPMATTAPAHATMFTGLLPRRHGVVKNGLILGERHDTMAERFQRNGYVTAAIVSSFVVSRRFGLAQGFSSYDDSFPERGSTARNRTFEDMEVPGGFDQRADRATEKAAAWLAQGGYLGSGEPERPFFLWVHYFDPHDPYVPPHRFRRPFAPSDESDALQAMLASYDGEVRYTDAQLGELLDTLDKAGRLADTLLVVTADHGEGLMTHGHQNHGIHLYEEAVRVPLVLRWPSGLAGGRRVAEPVALADLLPSVTRLAGLPEAPAAGDGVDLVPVLRGERPIDALRPIFLERREYETQRIGEFEIRGGKTGLRLRQYKYIEAPEERSFELFDLHADPGERTNLLPQRAREAEAMAKLLAEWRRRPGAARAEGDTTPETQEALRALGYVQ